RMAASIDEISGGRFTLGLGAGWNEPEFRAFGFPFDRTVSRFAESFEIVRRLLAGEHVTFKGEFQNVEDAVVLPPPRRRVPLMLGSNGARMLGIALPFVDAWNTWFSSYGNTVEGFANLRGDVDAACVRAGRDPGEIAHSAGAAGPRHKVWFVVAWRLAKRARAEFAVKAADSRIAEGAIDGVRVAIARPQTFMNDSGRAVRKLLDRYRIQPADLLVVFDEV